MQQESPIRVLRIDSSVQTDSSVSRTLGDEVIQRLRKRHARLELATLDLAQGHPDIDADWVSANFTPVAERDDEQRQRLDVSDAAVAALRAADILVITVPVYNFSVPSALKAWIDHVCRAGETFRYTENGPEGLLADRPVYLVMASGGVPFGSPVDFASPYLKQVLRFIGISDVRLIGAAGVASDAPGAQEHALEALGQWLPAEAGAAA